MALVLILLVLATIAFGQYQTSLQKARDIQRKASLNNISQALGAYRTDNGHYPRAKKGMIVVEGDEGEKVINWGEAFQVHLKGDLVIYMQSLPADPLSPKRDFCYRSKGDKFHLVTRLENKNDPQWQTPGYTCEGKKGYNYGVGNLK